jgi:hypothetical protein
VAATESLAGRSNPNASSDLAVAALLGEAAARERRPTSTNLPSIGDEELAATLSARVDGLVAEVAILAAQRGRSWQRVSPGRRSMRVRQRGRVQAPVDASAAE